MAPRAHRPRISEALLLCGLILSLSCSTVPITGRQQLNLIPSSTIHAMSFDQYDQFLQEHRLSRDRQQVRMVERVGRNIQRAVETFFAEKGQEAQLRGYEWEFHLVEDEAVNAWCMPGGKVVVYTGILPITRDEAGLAVVMGHEIAHAVAEHGAERMSQGLLTQLGGMALEKALESKPAETRSLFLAAYGIGSQVGVLLPYSRLHESEADRLGLIFMALAGYDPHEAPVFWERMSASKGGAAPPEFLSTHPSDQSRIRQLRERIPEAMEYYRP
ncbi:MAG: M48 family metalloprotease [Candidatus Eisenbacteria bacterium]|nr:M48 family metalloprotease [Candidatus Eisenbacteria bacterium]